jgi:hypothetical protein
VLDTNFKVSWVPVLTPVILATWEAEVRRIDVGAHPRKQIMKSPSPK